MDGTVTSFFAGMAPHATTAGQEPQQRIPPHRTGMEGRLFLSLHRDTAWARTTLAWQRSEPPLSVQRALYCEAGLPDMAYIYITSTSGGILQGDRHLVGLELGRGARAHVTTQGATRIYGTDRTSGEKGATQTLQARLDGGSYLEYMPDQIIPYANSGFSQDAAFAVHETATLVYAETISPGRAGMGESFAYRSCSLRMRVTDQDGRFRFVDAARMVPSQPSSIRSFGVMGGYDTVSSLYVLTERRHVADLQRGIDGIILGDGSVAGGAAVMSGGTGVLARLLAHDAESAKAATGAAAALARRTILDAPFTAVRKS